MRVRLAVFATVASGVAVALVAVPAAAAGGPTVNGVRFSQAQVSVGGLSYDYVQVAVDLSDPDGVTSGMFNDGGDFFWRPSVVLTRRGSPATMGINNFQLVAGTTTDGTWVATWPVIATDGGTWEPTEIVAEDANGNSTDVDPRTLGFDPTLAVTAAGVPALSVSFSPSIVHRGQSVTMSGYLKDSRGFVFGGQPIDIGQDNLCGVDGFGFARALTSSTGRYAYAWSTTTANSLNPFPHCALLLLPGGADSVIDAAAHNVGNVSAFGAPRVQYALLSVHPASTSAPAGSADSVTGSIWPFGSEMTGRVVLQRLVGDTWRAVGRASVRASGRFTLTANPPARGRNIYRVVKPSDYCVSGQPCTYLGTASPSFVITGT